MPETSKRRVKIVCTLGPASCTGDKIEQLIAAGMNVARLNFSHGEYDFHKSTFNLVRESASKKAVYVGIMQDLQGPKIRVGKLPTGGVELKNGDEVLLYPEGAQPSSTSKLTVPISAEIAKAIADAVRKGAQILFDDGRISTRVRQVNSPEILVEVESGGKLTSRKGMNLPGTPLLISCCTEKDYQDLKFGLDLGVDAVALSFVRSAEDIETVRAKIKHWTNRDPLVIAKIEREEAVESQDSIIEVSDGILVARGDMATELGVERVPVIQKQLIHACKELGVPIITATQMLESMVVSNTPTRAEASDIANAVFDGTDAVMLSAETASGKYPVESVQIMAKIILGAEQAVPKFVNYPEVGPVTDSIVESVQFSASRIAQHVGAAAVVCITHSGMAARALAKYRPGTPIFAFTDNQAVLQRLAFVWGVVGVLIPKIVATDDLFTLVEQEVKRNAIARDEDLVVITAGIPTLRKGTTNMVKVHRIGAPMERGTRRY